MGNLRDNKTEQFEITGVDRTIDRLYKANSVCARPAVAAGIRAMLKVFRKEIRKNIPHPSVRRMIGSRFSRSRMIYGGAEDTRHYRGDLLAKVGFKVGSASKLDTPKGSRAKGTGISSRNAHWYAVKTGNERFHKSGKSTGVMWGVTAKPTPVQDAFRSGHARATSVAVKAMKKTFEKKMQKWKAGDPFKNIKRKLGLA